MDLDAFFRRPYSQRQLIIFVDEKSFLGRFNESLLRRQKINKKNLVNAALLGPYGQIFLSLWDTYSEPRPFNSISVDVCDGYYIPKACATRFDLPLCHPIDKVVYVGHPVNVTTYIPIAVFHRRIFEEKFLEIIRILESLGAKEIFIENIDEQDEKIAENVTAKIANAEIGIISAQGNRKHTTRVWRGTYEGHSDPSLPEGLVWYPHERTWHHVVDSRLTSHAKSFEFRLQCTDDFRISYNLKAKIEELGFELGGEFQDYSSVSWVIRGDYVRP